MPVSPPKADHMGREESTAGGPVYGVQTVDEDEITKRAWVLYGLLYGFAQWFGAKRFDQDGDGDFDAADVQHVHNRLGRMLHISFSAPTTKGTKKAQKRRGVKTPPKKQGGKKAANKTAIETVVEEVAGGSAVVGEFAEEEVIQEHLRQFYPWFCVSWGIVLIGVWVGYALQTDRYARAAINVGYRDDWVLKKFENGDVSKTGCERECSKFGAECVGFSYDYQPNSECVLLKELRTSDGICRGAMDSTCGIYQFKKEDTTFADIFLFTAGLETAYPGETNLAGRSFCEDGVESEIWRLVSYQLSHVGMQHVLFNVLLLLAFGIPLEGAYGTLWMGVLWTMGVIGGGLSWLFWDARAATVGASGGCYSLIGMHLADTFLNWHSKKFRWMILLICVMVAGMELIMAFGKLGSDGVSKSSHCVHAGGLIAGMCVGTVFGLDLNESRTERIIKVFAFGIGLSLTIFSISWWYGANPFPATMSIFDSDARCWLGQVCLDANGGRGRDCEYKCVSCQTRECVETWYPVENGVSNKAKYGTAHTTDTVCNQIGYHEDWDLVGAPPDN